MLRWGHYDNAGYYRNDGSTPITAPGTGDSVNITVVVHGTSAAITYNGNAVATMTHPNPRGYVGLVTNRSKVAFDTRYPHRPAGKLPHEEGRSAGPQEQPNQPNQPNQPSPVPRAAAGALPRRGS